jgi:hypothetical protein
MIRPKKYRFFVPIFSALDLFYEGPDYSWGRFKCCLTFSPAEPGDRVDGNQHGPPIEKRSYGAPYGENLSLQTFSKLA